MSHFYGTLKGARGRGTRTGNKSSGMVTECASWNGAVRCSAYYNKEHEEDWVVVEFVPWEGTGVEAVIYNGPFNNPWLESTVSEDIQRINEAVPLNDRSEEVQDTLEATLVLCQALALMPLEVELPYEVATGIYSMLNKIGPQLETILGRETVERVLGVEIKPMEDMN